MAAKFQTEKDLVHRAVEQSAWSSVDSKAAVGAVKELVTPNGIVDIAFYRLRKDWKSHAVVGEIPSRWAYAFHKIPYRRKFSTDELAGTAGTSYRRARVALLDFSKLGLCVQAKDVGHWFKVRQPLMAISELISIEAKLRDWRGALEQATRYLAYSDQAWVLLDDHSAKPAQENLGEFEARNVGLASISTDGAITHYFSPPKSQRITSHDRWVVNSELLKNISYAR